MIMKEKGQNLLSSVPMSDKLTFKLNKVVGPSQIIIKSWESSPESKHKFQQN